MRKIRLLLVAALVLFLPFMVNVKAETKEKINVYLFRGDGCPHCAEAEEFFDELSKDEEYKEYYTLVDYEVWYDEENSKFMEKVGNALNTSVTGVPLIVIGDKYYNGYSSAMADQIKETIKEQYNKEDYKDVVQELIEYIVMLGPAFFYMKLSKFKGKIKEKISAIFLLSAGILLFTDFVVNNVM